jgi:hypothetical protein
VGAEEASAAGDYAGAHRSRMLQVARDKRFSSQIAAI